MTEKQIQAYDNLLDRLFDKHWEYFKLSIQADLPDYKRQQFATRSDEFWQVWLETLNTWVKEVGEELS